MIAIVFPNIVILHQSYYNFCSSYNDCISIEGIIAVLGGVMALFGICVILGRKYERTNYDSKR